MQYELNIFDAVKIAVPFPDVVRHYGYSPNRAGFMRCPFHTEKDASMKIYPDHFHCFGCGASGSAIDFVCRVYGVGPLDAVKKINADFRLGLPVDREPDLAEMEEVKRAREAEALFVPMVDALKGTLCALIYRANVIQRNIFDPDDLSDAEAYVLRYRERAEYLLSVLNNGTLLDQFEVVKLRKEVAKVCDQITADWRMRY